MTLDEPPPPDAADRRAPLDGDVPASPAGDLTTHGWRAWFETQGGWTFVAQLALLAVGTLGAVQLLVLLSLGGQLDRAVGDPAAVDRVLGAQRRLVTVLLPGLVAMALAALTLGAWRGVGADVNVGRGGEADVDGAPWRAPLLGMPVPLWAVAISTVALLALLVGWSEPRSLDAAQAGNRHLMVAVGLLAASCLVGPACLRCRPRT